MCNEVCKVRIEGSVRPAECGVRVDISFPPQNGDSGETTSTDGEHGTQNAIPLVRLQPGETAPFSFSPQQSIFFRGQLFHDLIRSGNSLRGQQFSFELRHMQEWTDRIEIVKYFVCLNTTCVGNSWELGR